LPPQGAVYTEVSYGRFSTYLLRSDGVIDRSKGSGIVNSINPPPGKKYIHVASGEHNSYFTRDDGVVDRSTGGGRINSSFQPPENTNYLSVSIGTSASYLVRDDGSVDRTTGKGKITQTMAAPEGAQYIAVAGGQEASYLVRSDGIVDRTCGKGEVSSSYEPPAGTKYVSVSDMFAITPNGKGDNSPPAMYFVRDDGAVDRAMEFVLHGDPTIHSTLNPPPGCQFVAASSGQFSSYLVQSDGKVARTTGKGVVENELMSPLAGVEVQQSNGCSIM